MWSNKVRVGVGVLLLSGTFIAVQEVGHAKAPCRALPIAGEQVVLIDYDQVIHCDVRPPQVVDEVMTGLEQNYATVVCGGRGGSLLVDRDPSDGTLVLICQHEDY